MDIVRRLRERAGKYDEYAWHSDIEIEAANVIEKMEVLLAHAVQEADGWHDDSRGGPIEDDPLIDLARAVLVK